MDLKQGEIIKAKPSMKEPPELELKDLPSHFEYAYLEENDKLLVIIAKGLKDNEKVTLLKVLKSHKRAIAWKITDIKGINPHFCTHKILMEDDYKPTVQSQRRVNPKIHKVIKKEVLKLLDAEMIYPISDSPWVNPVHCVPKKGGITVVANEENELIPTRLVTSIGEVLRLKKSNHFLSGSTTSLSESRPSFTSFETSDLLLEEFADELALFDPFLLGNEDFDVKTDLKEIELMSVLTQEADEIDAFLAIKVPTYIEEGYYDSGETDFDSEEDIIENLLNDDPIPEYERLTFDIEPDVPMINNVDELNKDECFNPGGEINVEVDDSFTFVIRTFLSYLTYLKVSSLLSSTRREDTIFDPGIFAFHFSSQEPAVRILQKSQENGQNRTNTDTGMERVHKSQKFSSKEVQGLEQGMPRLGNPCDLIFDQNGVNAGLSNDLKRLKARTMIKGRTFRTEEASLSPFN
ncbi:hypothetical protein Tco_0575033 [Tanacetum coccineum]